MPGPGATTARGLKALGSAMIDGLQTVGGYAWFWNLRRVGLEQNRLDSLSDDDFRQLCGGLIELTRYVMLFNLRLI